MLSNAEPKQLLSSVEDHEEYDSVSKLRNLLQSDDPCIRQSVLNSLWGKPEANLEMGPAIVQMAIDAASDSSPGVRTELCYVLQNQSGWGIDVTAGIFVLQTLLEDENSRVRHQAAYAIGILAKGKYNMSCCMPPLRLNVKLLVQAIDLNKDRKEIRKFADELAAIGQHGTKKR